MSNDEVNLENLTPENREMLLTLLAAEKVKNAKKNQFKTAPKQVKHIYKCSICHTEWEQYYNVSITSKNMDGEKLQHIVSTGCKHCLGKFANMEKGEVIDTLCQVLMCLKRGDYDLSTFGDNKCGDLVSEN